MLVVCPGIINTNIVNAPGMIAPGISEAQLQKLQHYYVEHGCLPDVVAEGIVRSVLADDLYLFVGPDGQAGVHAGAPVAPPDALADAARRPRQRLPGRRMTRGR